MTSTRSMYEITSAEQPGVISYIQPGDATRVLAAFQQGDRVRLVRRAIEAPSRPALTVLRRWAARISALAAGRPSAFPHININLG